MWEVTRTSMSLPVEESRPERQHMLPSFRQPRLRRRRLRCLEHMHPGICHLFTITITTLVLALAHALLASTPVFVSSSSSKLQPPKPRGQHRSKSYHTQGIRRGSVYWTTEPLNR